MQGSHSRSTTASCTDTNKPHMCWGVTYRGLRAAGCKHRPYNTPTRSWMTLIHLAAPQPAGLPAAPSPTVRQSCQGTFTACFLPLKASVLQAQLRAPPAQPELPAGLQQSGFPLPGHPAPAPGIGFCSFLNGGGKGLWGVCGMGLSRGRCCCTRQERSQESRTENNAMVGEGNAFGMQELLEAQNTPFPKDKSAICVSRRDEQPEHSSAIAKHSPIPLAAPSCRNAGSVLPTPSRAAGSKSTGKCHVLECDTASPSSELLMLTWRNRSGASQ